MRTILGYHGTLLADAQAMARGEFHPDKPRSTARWLGKGLYFFEDNYEAAFDYAQKKAVQTGQPGGVLRATIDLDACLDLTRSWAQKVTKHAYQQALAEGVITEESGPKQKPFETLYGMVRAGYRGAWKDYGRNALDYHVIERAIELAFEQNNMKLDTVRGVFLEGAELYRRSWLYDGAHVAVTVRDPPNCLSALAALEIG